MREERRFMNRSIRVLLVEDSGNDALLLLRQLHKGGYEPVSKRVETAQTMRAALDEQLWDIVISDYVLPGFGGLEALEVLKAKGLDLPFIVVSGQIGEDVAVKAMKAGAHDYMMKDNLTRLVPAVERELREAQVRLERKRSQVALRESEERFRQLAENIEVVFFMFEMESDNSPGRISYVSPVYEQVWGRPVESLLGNKDAWLEAIHADDRPEVRSALPKLGQRDFDLEFRLQRPDGTIRWIHYRAFPIVNEAGQVHRIAALADDVTERKEAQQRLEFTADELLRTVQELRQAEEQLRGRNEELTRARNELEMRVAQRTAALSKANAELRRQIEERRRLEKELLDITEQERQRIGIDLHDDLGQQLMGIAFMVKGLTQQLERESPDRAVEANKIHTQVSRTIQHAHDLALDMTAEFEGGSLDLALNQLARRVENLFGIQCPVKIDGDLSQIQSGAASHLYKIAQEALTNAIKHGKARNVVLRLTQEPQKIVLSVWNDGSPFHVEASQNSRMGLRIMTYRANVVGGSLDVQSNEKDGTLVTCALPLTAEAVSADQPAVSIAG